MRGVNKVILLGRIGQDPEVRSLPSGTKVCNLSLATTESVLKDGNREERTEWHRLVLWSRHAELAQQYVRKGNALYIEGRLQTSEWTDKDGVKRFRTEIVVSEMQFVDTGRRNDAQNPNASGPDLDAPPAMPTSGGWQAAPSAGGYGRNSAAPQSAPSSRMQPPPSNEDIPF